MIQFIEIIDTYLLNYSSYAKGKINFECEYGELIFNKQSNKVLTVSAIYIFPQYRKKGLCRSILHYLIDNSSEQFKYVCIESVLSNVLYEYLLRFKYKNKTFKNTISGFIYKVKN